MQKINFQNKKRELSSAGSILNQYDFVDRFTKQGKYLKEEFQDFGVRISHKLQDKKHKSLYIKLAKDLPRNVLEETLSFTLDYPTKDTNRGKLFMWKLADLCKKKGINLTTPAKIKRKKKRTESNQMKLFK